MTNATVEANILPNTMLERDTWVIQDLPRLCISIDLVSGCEDLYASLESISYTVGISLIPQRCVQRRLDRKIRKLEKLNIQ